MAITSVTEHWEGSSSQTRGAIIDTDTTTITTKWIVETDNALDQADTIRRHFRATSTLPYAGRTLLYGNDINSDLICNGLNIVKRTTSRTIWDVEAEFESRSSSGFPAGTANIPTGSEFAPLELEISSSKLSVPVERAIYLAGFEGKADITRNRMDDTVEDFVNAGGAFGKEKKGVDRGGPVCNSAFVNFDPPAEKELTMRVFRITASYPVWDRQFWKPYNGVINSDEILAQHGRLRFSEQWSWHTIRVDSINARPALGSRGTPYWRVTVELWENPNGWDLSLPDRGIDRRCWVGDDNGRGGTYVAADFQDGMGRTSPILEADGQNRISEPVLLDGNGQPLAEDKPPVYVWYQIYDEVPLNPLLKDLGSR